MTAGKEAYTQNTFWTDQLDLAIGNGAFRIALAVSLEVSKIANMAFIIRWCTMGLGKGIDCGFDACE